MSVPFPSGSTPSPASTAARMSLFVPMGQILPVTAAGPPPCQPVHPDPLALVKAMVALVPLARPMGDQPAAKDRVTMTARESQTKRRARRQEAVLAAVMGPSTAGLGGLRNGELTVGRAPRGWR